MIASRIYQATKFPLAFPWERWRRRGRDSSRILAGLEASVRLGEEFGKRAIEGAHEIDEAARQRGMGGDLQR